MARRAGWWRAGRWTNLLLLVVLIGAGATGVLAFGVGSPGPARWVAVAHAVIGFAVLALVPWKQVIVRRGLRRWRRPRAEGPAIERSRPGASAAAPSPVRGGAGRLPGGAKRLPSEAERRGVSWAGVTGGVALGVLVVVAIVAGALHALVGDLSFGGISLMQVHVGAAVGAVPLLVAHVVVRVRRPRWGDVSRRAVLRLGVVGAVGGGLYLLGSGVAWAGRLPGRRRRATGSYEEGSGDQARMPVTQWLADPVPVIDVGAYRLEVVGPGGRRSVTFDELDGGVAAGSGAGAGGGPETVRAVLDCTGGWYAVQDWTGVRLDRLLGLGGGDGAEVRAGAKGGSKGGVEGLAAGGGVWGRAVEVVSVTGYRRRFPVGDVGRLWVVTRVAGEALAVGHGAPVRLVAPGRRGFWWVKWVVRVEVVDGPWWWQAPFPTR
jgi:cytochrome b561